MKHRPVLRALRPKSLPRLVLRRWGQKLVLEWGLELLPRPGRRKRDLQSTLRPRQRRLHLDVRPRLCRQRRYLDLRPKLCLRRWHLKPRPSCGTLHLLGCRTLGDWARDAAPDR